LTGPSVGVSASTNVVRIRIGRRGLFGVTFDGCKRKTKRRDSIFRGRN
jgi:hypothetical protein